jgi:hypothetical protein
MVNKKNSLVQSINEIKILESITTRYLLLSSLVAIITAIAIFSYIFYYESADIDKLSKYIDILFKSIVLIIGTFWALNRYYISRTDIIRLRIVNSNAKLIKDTDSIDKKQELGLLILNLDILNEGNVLIRERWQYYVVESVFPSNEGTKYEQIYRFPPIGFDHEGPIEPGSWAAINDSIPIPKTIRAVRIYLEIHIPNEPIWTWHKTFEI